MAPRSASFLLLGVLLSAASFGAWQAASSQTAKGAPKKSEADAELIAIEREVFKDYADLHEVGPVDDQKEDVKELEAEGWKWSQGAQTRGKTIPTTLLIDYARFVRAARNPNSEVLTRLCLPQAVAITTEERPPKRREYGRDINVPFLRHVFRDDNGLRLAQIQGGEPFNDDCWRIGTGYSILWYVKTKSQGWKLYKYADEPIE
jgi:hypothetical protein